MALVLGLAAPALAAADADPTVQLLQAQPGNDGLAAAAARKAMQAGDLTAAEGYLKACIATSGDHRLARTELGWLRFLQGKTNEAIDLLKVVEKGPVLPVAQARLAWVYAQRGMRADAIRLALAARKAKEGTPLALLTLGTVADDPARSRQYFLDAAAADASPWPHYYLGERATGDEALKAYGESFARSLASTDPFEIGAKGRSLAAIAELVGDDPKLAHAWADILDDLIGKYPGNLALSDMLVEAHLRSGRQEFAIAELRRRLGFATNKAEILRSIARLYVDLQQDELALDAYDRTLKLLGVDQRSPLAHEARCERVALLLGVGRESEAGVELDRILKEAPENRRAKLLRGLLYALKQDWQKAQEAIAGVEPVSSEERLIVNLVRYRQGKGARWAQIFGAPL
jgi:predicted Zn-dependent protease